MSQIDGIDCSALGLRDLRSRMSIIPQVRLFGEISLFATPHGC